MSGKMLLSRGGRATVDMYGTALPRETIGIDGAVRFFPDGVGGG